MNTSEVVPLTDPIPLPGPVWLFWVLLVVTFLLHTLAMNCVVGGTLIALVGRFRSPASPHRKLASHLAGQIPSFLAATITLGIAPLLFVQVLYGRFFYSSSVIIGWPWFSVIVLLIAAYYGSYILAFKSKGEQGTRLRWLNGAALLLFTAIAFIYTNNFTLMLTPEKWFAEYQARPSGLNLNLGEPMLASRFLHTLIGATAVAGCLVVITGLFRRKEEPEYAGFLIRQGGYWFVGATMLEFAVGAWYLISLPLEKMMIYMGDDLIGTALLMVSVVAALVAVFAMLVAIRRPLALLVRPVLLSLSMTAVVLVSMDLMRDILRSAYLGPYLSDLPVKTQWDVLTLFLVLFLAALALWGVMMRKYFFM